MARERNIRNAYDIVNSRGDLITTISERATDSTSTTLTLHGRGYYPYGQRRNENVVRLIENFAGPTPPVNAIDGQLWWKESEQLYVYDAAVNGSPGWQTVVPASAGIGFFVRGGDGVGTIPGDGLPDGSPLTVTLYLRAGSGLTFTSVGGGIDTFSSVIDWPIQHQNEDYGDLHQAIITGEEASTRNSTIRGFGSPLGNDYIMVANPVNNFDKTNQFILPLRTNQNQSSLPGYAGRNAPYNGKYYMEFDILDIEFPSNTGWGPYIGVVRHEYIRADNRYTSNLNQKVWYDGYNSGTTGRIQQGDSTYDTDASIARMTRGDVVGMAIDYTGTGKVWFSHNGTWVGAGTQDPATNQGGYWPTDFTTSTATGADVYARVVPAMWLFNDSTLGTGSPFNKPGFQDKVGIKLTSAKWDYSAPTGFTEWPSLQSEPFVAAAGDYKWKYKDVLGDIPIYDGTGGEASIASTLKTYLNHFDHRAFATYVRSTSGSGSNVRAFYDLERTGNSGKYYMEYTIEESWGGTYWGITDKRDLEATFGSPIWPAGNLSGDGLGSPYRSELPGNSAVAGDNGEIRNTGGVPDNLNEPTSLYRVGGNLWDTGNPAKDGRGGTVAAAGDVMMLAFDFDRNRMWYGVNGVWSWNQDPTATGSPIGGIRIWSTGGSPDNNLAEARWIPGIFVSSGAGYFNLGGLTFDYEPPTGFLPWATLGDSAGDLLSADPTSINHTGLQNYVAAEHLNHGNITLNAGAGLTGGGPITSSVSLNVGAGRGISVGTSVGVSSDVWRTFGDQTVTGVKTFGGRIRGNNLSSAGLPSFSFDGDTNTGMYYTPGRSNEISFSTGSTQRFRIESNGVLRSLNSSYESLLTNADDIPNKKYVDDNVVSPTPTTNTFVGTSSISGLDGAETYLVTVYGKVNEYTPGGTGLGLLQSITLRRGSTTPGAGTFVASTPSQFINWFDGDGISSAAFICPMSGSTSINCQIDTRGSSSSYMTAIQITGS